MGGQSNMLGRADIASSDPLLKNTLENGGIDPNDILYHYNFRGSETLEGNGFDTLWHRPSDDDQTGNFGCELTFGRDIQLEYGLGEQVVILKYAVASTNVYSDWYADGTSDQNNDGAHYQNFKSLCCNDVQRFE